MADSLVGDACRLRQILIHLVGNALKFTERGEVTVRVVSVATQHTELAPIHFIIRDTGIGIPMEKQAAIFESFTQADGSVARRFARRSDTTATPLRILVAEDNTINQRVVVGILGKAGHSTTLVSNGREALASFNREPFDLILMDAQMPDMDGFEATAAIRAGEKRTGSHVPIVV